jgi:predicted cupin superfamily sugar epimerase
MTIVQELIQTHGLIAHPEGGFFKETYRSEFSTGIFYLLSKGHKSSFHRIKSDEMWHFYAGDSLTVVELTQAGALKETRLDKNNVQYVVPAGVWFGAYLENDSDYAFVGCTVAPAFHYEDFELAQKDEFLATYPQHARMIHQLIT